MDSLGSVHWTAEVPRSTACEVLVVGAGPAGTVAAIQAAEAGARTILVEKNGLLGGTTTTGRVNFPGLYHAWGQQVIAGLGWSLIEETVRRGGATLPDFTAWEGQRHWRQQILVNRFCWAEVLDDRCQQAGVDLWLHTMPADLRRGPGPASPATPGTGPAGDPGSAGGAGWEVLLTTRAGLRAVTAEVVVDATGDASVTALAGYAVERSAVLQPGTLSYTLDGYDPAAVDPEALAAVYQAALAAGEILPTDHGPGPRPLWHEVQRRGGPGQHIPGHDAADPPGRTAAELAGRAAVGRVVRLLRRVPGMEGVEVVDFGDECGIRETRRIVGEAAVDVASYVSGRVWDDAVCYSFYPIDVHQAADSTIDIRPLEPGIVPTIPYGALIPRGSDRLLAAGRCVAGDAEASSAYRVQASCQATGQVAGAAAALAAAARCSVGAVPLAQLRALLRQHGAIVPGP